MKTVLITGASTGIGEACARAAYTAGHRVALVSRSAGKLRKLAGELGDRAVAIPCDVTKWSAQHKMFEQVTNAFEKLDVVFANAGIGSGFKGTENGSPDDFAAMIRTNCLGLTYTAKLAIPLLKRSHGQFVVTGSQAGVNVIPGSVYGATKWFVRGYARNLAAELEGTRIRVTNLEPGMVDTPFFDSPQPQALRPRDVAKAFMFVLGQPENVDISHILVRPTPPATK